ncbi:MAG TPA: fumarylacetoacetate hydrolase family protein, partial [Steroidobacteraceae bacterium]|nr:fumarylacetoacetate hydrolase family protein [Steroidobacteraceae bacterium]
MSYTRNGTRGYGAVVEGGIIELQSKLGDRYPDLRAALSGDALHEIHNIIGAKPAIIPLDRVSLLPVIPNPDKILCVGLNYATHVAETRRPDSKYPSIFTRFSDTQVGHGAPVLRPTFSERFDWEGELAVVIGRGGRHIPQTHALDHVAGYSCYNDVSVRDWQRHTHQFTPGKNFPGTGAFGPWLVTTDEIPDVTALTVTTRVNGKVMQQASVKDLIFPVPVIIEYVSTFTPLAPGDVIATGTPGGVGDRREPPLYLKDGDTVEVEIDRIGVLRNSVQAD